MTTEEIKSKIESETALIKELESKKIPFDYSVDMYHENNTPWHIHATKIKDAYWRRRNLWDKLHSLIT